MGVFKMNKKGIFVLALTLGVIVGLIVSARLNLSPSSNAEGIGKEAISSEGKTLEDEGVLCDDSAFIRVAEKVGPAVVSISTERTEKVTVRYRRGPFGRDDIFDRFFRDFYGDSLEREFKRQGLGSGVIIDEDGYILTNEHVISGADKITVTLADGREFEGVLRGKDTRSDLAIIKIEAKDIPFARLGNSDDVKIGQWGIAIGNPFGYAVHSPKPTLTVGVISAVDRSLPRVEGRDRDYSGLIQTDAAINPGNSGGPLVNTRSEVVGINVAIFSTTGGYQGVGFAIPINSAKAILDTLIAGKKVLYGWLGVSVQGIDEKLAEYFSLPDTKGVIVTKVLPGSPAEKSGMRDGDILRRFAGKDVEGLEDLLRQVSKAKVGQIVKADIMRDHKPMAIDIEIGQRPSAAEELKALSEKVVTWRGLEVTDITPEITNRYKIEQGNGVIVTNVMPDSPAEDGGIMRGDLISRINNERIRNIKDYNRVIAGLKGNALVRTARGYTVIKQK